MVVEQLKSREADDLWVSLGNCDIEDSKIASLTEALAQSATVTAVDLSRNNITASGAQVCACHLLCKFVAMEGSTFSTQVACHLHLVRSIPIMGADLY